MTRTFLNDEGTAFRDTALSPEGVITCFSSPGVPMENWNIQRRTLQQNFCLLIEEREKAGETVGVPS